MHICPICNKEGKIQFTQGKGKPFIACDQHKVEGLLWAMHISSTKKKPWWKTLFGIK